MVEHLRAAVIDAAGTGLQQAGLAAHRNPLTVSHRRVRNRLRPGEGERSRFRPGGG
jgi:hypothetical protein